MSQFALLFPGQGSQSVGMLDKYISKINTTLEEASDILNFNVSKLITEGPSEQLNQTIFTQTVMLTADIALYRLLNHTSDIIPAMMAGHSLGEYAALVASDALEFSAALRLVQKRAELMQSSIQLGKGAMAAIVGLDDKVVQEICELSSYNDEQVMPANYNAIGQVVIAGLTHAVNRAIKLAEEKGARLATLIPVSVPCHCDLLKEAAEEYVYSLEKTTFSIPKIPVISNVNVDFYKTPEQIRTLLAQQLYCPVRWVETVQKMKLNQIDNVIEVGPGKVLSGLVKRIDKTIQAKSVDEYLLG